MQLKTLFLNSEHTESMTVNPALPYTFDGKVKDKWLFVPIVAQAYHGLLHILMKSRKARCSMIYRLHDMIYGVAVWYICTANMI